MGPPRRPPSDAVSRQTGAQKRHSFRNSVVLDLDPAQIEGSHRVPAWEPLFGRYCNQLVYPFGEDFTGSDERKHPRADRQAPSQRWRVGQSPSFSDCRVDSRQSLISKPEAKEGIPQESQ